MTYVVSNLHGHFEEYKTLLRTIQFNADRDVLYVLGDIVDYGPASMELIEDMSMSLGSVTTGYVTTAIRDTHMDGLDVKKGEFTGYDRRLVYCRF